MAESTLDALNTALGDDESSEDVEETAADEQEQEEQEEKSDDEEEQEQEQEEEQTEDEEQEDEEEQEEGQEEEETEETTEADVDIPPSALARSLQEKHKGIFKEFPQLRGVLFQHSKYRDVFPTPEEAEEAAERSNTLEYLENTVGTGTPDPLFESLDENALKRFATEFVPKLAQKNPKIAHQAFLPVMNGLLRSAISAAQKLSNANLGKAAQIISQFLNGTNEPPEATSVEENPEVKKKLAELNQREQQTQMRAHRAFAQKVTQTGDKKLLGEIRKTFDSDKNLSSIEKDALAERTFQRVIKQLSGDGNHIRGMDSLWARARKAGYSEEWIPRIISAMLGGARSILPGVRAKVRAEALKTKKPVVKKAGIVVNPGKAGKTAAVSHGKVAGLRKGDIDFSKTSTLDIFSGRATLKSK